MLQFHRSDPPCYSLVLPPSTGRRIPTRDFSDGSDAAAAAEEEEEEEDDLPMNAVRGDSENPGEEDTPKTGELQLLVGEVFDAVTALKRAYVGLQEAHSPWDVEKIRVADVAVVAELRKLNLLSERFDRTGGNARIQRSGAATLHEVVAPYEEAMEKLKREVKAKQLEADNLREKLNTTSSFDRTSGKSKGGTCTTQALTPGVELFEETMCQVKEASKAFTSQLLALMRSARWDMAAAIRSIEAASSGMIGNPTTKLGSGHARYALESYINRKFFHGFDHETFYIDGSLSSILYPDQHRRDCFAQYHDMKSMYPIELLGVLPSCSFGNFCFKKYLSIVHPKMEESLFGDMEQRQQVLAGHHPRTRFYGEFLDLAKAVWLLHLLAFSFDPPPSHFEACKGADFHSQYMENVVKTTAINAGGARAGASMVVGMSVSPGFKLHNGSIIKARVYLIPKN